MRTDQYDKLKQLSEELVDRVIDEAEKIKAIEPKVARSQKPDVRMLEERRLHWRKKNVTATLQVLSRINWLTGVMERTGQKSRGPKPDEKDPNKLVGEAIKLAEAEVARIRQKGTELDG